MKFLFIQSSPAFLQFLLGPNIPFNSLFSHNLVVKTPAHKGNNLLRNVTQGLGIGALVNAVMNLRIV